MIPMITVKHIYEADYGCEERPEGAPLMALLVLEQDGKEIRVTVPDALVDELELSEGAEISGETFEALKVE